VETDLVVGGVHDIHPRTLMGPSQEIFLFNFFRPYLTNCVIHSRYETEGQQEQIQKNLEEMLFKKKNLIKVLLF